MGQRLTTIPPTLGAIIAGGRARRLGGVDKALLTVGGQPIMTRLLACLRPFVARLLINANGEPDRFAGFGVPVISDTLPDSPGPLAGLLTVLEWTAAHEPRLTWVVTVPGDTPFLPADLVPRLHAARARDNAVLARAASAGRAHPTVALWPVSLRDELRTALLDDGVRGVERFTRRYAVATEAWPTEPIEPFTNINTADDLALADQLALTQNRFLPTG